VISLDVEGVTVSAQPPATNEPPEEELIHLASRGTLGSGVRLSGDGM
jgi:hypothetical protein